MHGAEPFISRLECVRRLPRLRAIAVLDEVFGACGPDEAGAVCLSLLDLAITPQPRKWPVSAPRIVRLFARTRRRARTGAQMGALRVLMKRWARVPEDLRHVVMVAGRGRLAEGAAGLAASAVVAERASVCELALAAGETALAPALADLFSDAEPSVAAAAERALLGLALHVSGADLDTGVERVDPTEEARADGDCEARGRALVTAALARVAVRAAGERRRPAILGVAVLLDRVTLARGAQGTGDPLVAWFLAADEDATAVLRSALRSTPGGLARRRALEWLSYGALGAAALERLSRASTAHEHECVLTGSHLLANPARARRAAMLGRGRRHGTPDVQGFPAYLPAPDVMAELSVAARRAVGHYLTATGTGLDLRRRVIEGLLADEDALTRHACARAAPPGLLPDLCLDGDARVARTSVYAWSLAGERVGGKERRPALRPDDARQRLLALLARSPHRGVRSAARQDLALNAWLDVGTAAGRASARRRLLREPGAMIADLRSILLTGEAEDRVAAVMLVRHLGLQIEFERELLGLCEGDGERARIAATAIGALAGLRSPDAVRTLWRHTHASEQRVRANAVEGTARLVGAVPEPAALHSRLIELKDDADHRVRANALRGLLTRGGGFVAAHSGPRRYEPAAVESLLAMLRDDRVEHRLAGAWVAGRVLPFEGASCLGPRWADASVRVHELGADADPRVRVRAVQCSGLLRARLGARASEEVA